MTSPKKLINIKSPPYGAPEKNILEPDSPSCNPFDDVLKKDEKISIDSEFNSSPFYSCNTSFTELNMPFVAPVDLNSSDMLARESLGILPNTTLLGDSLTSNLLNLSIKEMLNTSSSPRESLGVLNLSAMDFGRESIGLFNIQNSFLRRNSIGDEIQNNVSFNLEDFNFGNIDTGLEHTKKSPLQSENPVPVLILSTSTTQEKINSLSGLNNAFIFPHSRISSALSCGSSYNLSCNPYFNSRSLEEPSKISPGSSQKDSEISNQSVFAITEPLNDAFRISTNNNNKHSVSQIVTSTTGTKNSSCEEMIRKRMKSLPVTLDDHIFADIDLGAKILNASGPIICRGGEKDKELDDSVFVEAKRVASIIEDTSFISDEKLNDSNELLLDATPQPEWPEDLDSSLNIIEEKAKSSKCDQETILKQVDKMLGMQPVNLEEKLKLKNSCQSASFSMDNNLSQNSGKISVTSPDNNGENRSDNYSQNISKISRGSQADNFSQNFSKISQIREEKVIKLVQDVSDLVNDNENLSQTQMEQLRAMVHRLTNMFCDSRRSKSSSAEDSGHSSVDDGHLQENKCLQYDGKNKVKTAEEASRDNSEEICQALDLSCRGQSSAEIVRRPSMPTSPALVDSPARLIKKLNHKDNTNASGASIESNTSDGNKNASKINYSNASARSGNISTASRHSNISQNRVVLGAGKLKKSTVGVATTAKKGPLRAVLPIENMAKEKNVTKVAVTPERKDNKLPFGLCSKKTSTPIQEPKMKPMAASTPANRNPEDPKEPNTPLARPKFNRSFSYQHKASSTAETLENTKTRQSVSGIAKTGNKSQVKVNDMKLARRNSVTEGTLRKDSESPMRIKRSFSTGKEPKILSALSRVRQNILNSPYYNPRKSSGAAAGQSPVLSENVLKTGTDLKGCGQELKRLSMISHPNKPGKENLKP